MEGSGSEGRLSPRVQRHLPRRLASGALLGCSMMASVRCSKHHRRRSTLYRVQPSWQAQFLPRHRLTLPAEFFLADTHPEQAAPCYRAVCPLHRQVYFVRHSLQRTPAQCCSQLQHLQQERPIHRISVFASVRESIHLHGSGTCQLSGPAH